MDWYADCSYEPKRKRLFHATGRSRLRSLAAKLRWPAGSFDLRSSHGGIAVSGEITLHHDLVYVQVSQPATRSDTGILIGPAKAGATTPAAPTSLRPCRCWRTSPPSRREFAA